MKEKFKINNGNNVPIHSPLYSEPFVPYSSLDTRVVTAICETDPDIIKAFLELTPFEYVDNKFTVSIMDLENCDKGSFKDASIVVPVKYKETHGGYYLCEFNDTDWAIAAGRELWGNPKKYGDMEILEKEDKVIATATVNGKELIRLEFELDSTLNEKLPKVKTTPFLNIHRVPNPDGLGVYSERIIMRDNTPDCKVKSLKEGKIKVNIQGDPWNPLHELLPLKVIGGTFRVEDFHATEKNGWGKTIDVIK